MLIPTIGLVMAVIPETPAQADHDFIARPHGRQRPPSAQGHAHPVSQGIQREAIGTQGLDLLLLGIAFGAIRRGSGLLGYVSKKG